MSLFSRYIGFLYLKYFLFLFIALECFFVFIDLIKDLYFLPTSANLFVLLLAYNFIYAAQFILPLALILAQIILILVLLKSSQFTAFLSLGYSKARIFAPIFFISFLFSIIFIISNTTPFAYAKERVDSIIKTGFVGDFKKDLFVKYNNQYIYFQKIYPLLQSAAEVLIYDFKDNELTSIIESKTAKFNGDEWILSDVNITQLNTDSKKPLETLKVESYSTLNGFKPKILENIYESQGNASIIDAYQAINLLKQQEANTQKVRSILYSLILFPLFAPFIMIILFFFTPDSNRYVNLAALVFFMILGILVTWGIFFGLSRLSMSGFFRPEFSIVLPFFILFLASLFVFYKRSLNDSIIKC
ncbi:MAG: LptF/LptG family permease [Helicobacter sp.]|nr:LptF/LptG family permease [Helicobacter sp.]